MKDIALHPASNIATVDSRRPRPTELDPFLAERGRFFPVGHCEFGRLGGFLSGGTGMAFYGTTDGLARSIESIDVVLADGSKVRASVDEKSGSVLGGPWRWTGVPRSHHAVSI